MDKTARNILIFGGIGVFLFYLASKKPTGGAQVAAGNTGSPDNPYGDGGNPGIDPSWF